MWAAAFGVFFRFQVADFDFGLSFFFLWHFIFLFRWLLLCQWHRRALDARP
jgi:hypothetical protein